MKLECKHRCSQIALNELIDGLSNVIQMTDETNKNLIQQHLDTLQTQYRRNKVYMNHWAYIPPEKIVMGYEYVTYQGKTIRKVQYGYYIPIESILKNLLKISHIREWFRTSNMQNQTKKFWTDINDGSCIAQNPYFLGQNYTSKLILFYDDCEFCNPIGARTKKHAMGFVYVTFSDIPPMNRSSYSSVFLLAVAKTRNIKKFGLGQLLKRFTVSLCELDTGIQILLENDTILLRSRLVSVPCDSLGSSFMGGFKMPGPFSNKPCRMCNVSSSTIANVTKIKQLLPRTMSQHLEALDILESPHLSKLEKKYWSKSTGITGRSVLLDIPYLKLEECLVQDPMHVLLEGVTQFTMVELLKKCHNEKICKIEWISAKLQSFKYSYLDLKNKPCEIDKQVLLKRNKLRQNAACILSLTYILPIILRNLAPRIGKLYQLFMNICRITTIAFSPFADENTAGELQIQIESFLRGYKKICSNSSFKPKHHFLLHLTKQMLLYGPLKHSSVFRMEAKHQQMKQCAWQNWRNLEYSIAHKHQKMLCYEMGERESSQFLLNVDEAKKLDDFIFSDIYSTLNNCFLARVLSEVNLNGTQPTGEITVTRLKEVVHNNIIYRCGALLLKTWDDLNTPSFMEITEVCTYQHITFFVVHTWITCDYEWESNCYIVEKGNEHDLVLLSKLQNPWPIPLYTSRNVKLVTNRACHFGSGYTFDDY